MSVIIQDEEEQITIFSKGSEEAFKNAIEKDRESQLCLQEYEK